MAKQKTATTIKLSGETKGRLDSLKEYERETYDEVINKVFNIINITIRNPLAGARIFRNIKRKKIGKAQIAERLLARHETRQELETEPDLNSQ
jgi:predicted transcriptional regulator